MDANSICDRIMRKTGFYKKTKKAQSQQNITYEEIYKLMQELKNEIRQINTYLGRN